MKPSPEYEIYQRVRNELIELGMPLIKVYWGKFEIIGLIKKNSSIPESFKGVLLI